MRMAERSFIESDTTLDCGELFFNASPIVTASRKVGPRPFEGWFTEEIFLFFDESHHSLAVMP